MTDLSALIRLHKHELDEKRRILAQLYAAMSALESERQALEDAFVREKEAVDVTGDVHFTFASYVERVGEQREDIRQREMALEQEIEAAKESLMETFSEMKKYEMTQEQRERLEEEERLLKESRLMDEIGLETFRRSSEKA